MGAMVSRCTTTTIAVWQVVALVLAALPHPAAAGLAEDPPPLDVLLVIDNSGSMGLEIAAVEDNLALNFASVLEASGIDYRIIAITRHGDDASESLCVEQPLSSVPPGGCNPPPTQPGNTDLFRHYSVEVASHDAWCVMFSGFSSPDEFNLALTGWQAWLRDGSVKSLILVSDDGIQCGGYDDNDAVNDGETAAVAFDADLIDLSSADFGTAENRLYRAYSIVGLAAKLDASEPYLPNEPVTTSQCAPGSADPGTGHQSLSALTGGLRFPLCATTFYDAFFQQIARDSIDRLHSIFADGFESGGTTGWSATQ